MKTFEAFGLHKALLCSVAEMGFTAPTPIQTQAIPPALAGKDVWGSAQTGTGKTAAFALPVLQHLLTDKSKHALVLAPTRELAKQIMETFHDLVPKGERLNTAFVIGGEPMGPQFKKLKAKPRIVVGTPGRINDHLERKSLDLSQFNLLVLDETDRMLDMGFSIQLERIAKRLPQKRQTFMFSATFPKSITSLAKKYLHEPVRIEIGSTTMPIAKIKQEAVKVQDESKYSTLSDELHKRDGSVIVFVKTKRGTERLAKKLVNGKHSAEAIHGDLRQRKRERVVKGLRSKKYRILVATDVVARGLDIPHIEHVINYDLPQAAEDYVHRIGRTARAGAEGSSLSLITPQDTSKWRAIQRFIDPEKAEKEKAEKKDAGSGRRSQKAGRPRRRPRKGGPRRKRA